jgi:gliding motility-associated-like protein
MNKLIIYLSLIFIFFNSPVFTQNIPIWKGYVSYQNGINEADEQVCDIVKNGQLRIEPMLSNQAVYWSNFLYRDTICISRDFSYEVRLKNGNTNALNNECKFGFFSNGKKTNITLSNTLLGQSNTLVQIADSVIAKNQLNLVTDLSQWRTIRLNFMGDTIALKVDNVEKYKVVYKHNICNLDIINFVLPSDGSIDWIKVYDSQNTVVWQEEFQSCSNFTPGIICDPFRLDQSISISRPCASDTLSLSANFPAMSYRWTNPLLKVDSNRVAKYINPINGKYELTANVNRCFIFSKNFDVNISQRTVINQDVQLCLGKTFRLPKGRIVNIAGMYQDTLQTKAGCDSIIITKLSFYSIPVNTLNVSLCSEKSYKLPSGKIVTTAGLYRDTSQNTEGCLQITEVNLTFNNSIDNNITANICEGQNYTLPKGKVVNISGVYKDTIKLSGGCDSIVITNLVVNSIPKVKISVPLSDNYSEGETLPLSTNDIPNANYTWLENSKIIFNSEKSPSVSIKGGENIYKVIVKTTAGCTATDSIKISALPKIELPNAFSPNNDNLNDSFTIVNKGNNESFYSIESFLVFDRFGKQVYNNQNGIKGWDGKFNNEDLISDVYVYTIKLRAPNGTKFSFSGEVTLLR